jgi:hypothetical protein
MSISAMKQALDVLLVLPEHGGNAFTRAADALRQAIDEAEKQEPVAYVDGYFGGHCVVQPIDRSRLFNSGTPFYTAPPKPEWVGLTDTEVVDISKATSVYGSDNHYEVLEFVAAIEAKLKEKNA